MTETPESDPQAVLRALEAELAARRDARQRHGSSRTAFRVGSLIFLVAGLAGALLALQVIVTQLKPQAAPAVEAR